MAVAQIQFPCSLMRIHQQFPKVGATSGYNRTPEFGRSCSNNLYKFCSFVSCFQYHFGRPPPWIWFWLVKLSLSGSAALNVLLPFSAVLRKRKILCLHIHHHDHHHIHHPCHRQKQKIFLAKDKIFCTCPVSFCSFQFCRGTWNPLIEYACRDMQSGSLCPYLQWKRRCETTFSASSDPTLCVHLGHKVPECDFQTSSFVAIFYLLLISS